MLTACKHSTQHKQPHTLCGHVTKHDLTSAQLPGSECHHVSNYQQRRPLFPSQNSAALCSRHRTTPPSVPVTDPTVSLTCRRRPNMYSDSRSPGSGDKKGPAMATSRVALLGRIPCTSGCSVSPRPPHPLLLVRSWKGVGHTTNSREPWDGH